MTTLTRLAWTDASTASQLNNGSPTTGVEDAALLVTRPDRIDLWSCRIDELLAIRSLADDWDGQAAKAPSTELVDSALVLAVAFRRGGAEAPSRIVPGVNGTLVFEWQAGEEYCEIEVPRPYHAEGLRVVPGQPPEHWVIEAE
jgi:hypothetical protein